MVPFGVDGINVMGVELCGVDWVVRLRCRGVYANVCFSLIGNVCLRTFSPSFLDPMKGAFFLK